MKKVRGGKFLNLIANHSDVEWSVFKTSNDRFGDQVTLATSGEKDKEYVGATFAYDKVEDLIYLDHSHPGKGPVEDFNMLKLSAPDKATRDKFRAVNPRLKMRIYLPGTGYSKFY